MKDCLGFTIQTILVKTSIPSLLFLISKLEMIYMIDFFDKNCFTNVYGLGRSILALSTLTTLLFTSPYDLFDYNLFDYNKSYTFLDSLNIFYLLGYENLMWANLISIIILILVVTGFYPRITGILHFIVVYGFHKTCSITDGGDQVAMIIVFLLIPVTLLDGRVNHFYKKKMNTSFFSNSISVLILKILIPLQMAVIYLHAGIHKLYTVPEWRDGTALYYILLDPLFANGIFRVPFVMDITSTAFMVNSMTWGTILLEIVLFGSFFMSYSKRKYTLVLGFFFHFLIIVYFGLVSFFFSMFAGLIILSLDPNTHINISKWKSLIPKWKFSPSKI